MVDSLRMNIQGPQASGVKRGSGAGWDRRGHSCALLQTTFVVIWHASPAHMSSCTKPHTQIKPKKETSHASLLWTERKAHLGWRFNLSKRNADWVWMTKCWGTQARVYQRKQFSRPALHAMFLCICEQRVCALSFPAVITLRQHRKWQ